MKKWIMFLVLALCMLVSSVGLAVDKFEPEDYYGTWYFTASEVEGHHNLATDTNSHITIRIYDSFHLPIGEYIDVEYPNQTEHAITMEYVKKELSEEEAKYEWNFLFGSHFKMCRVNLPTPESEFYLYLKDKDTLVLRHYFIMDKSQAVATLFFSKKNPFIQKARKYKLKKEA